MASVGSAPSDIESRLTALENLVAAEIATVQGRLAALSRDMAVAATQQEFHSMSVAALVVQVCDQPAARKQLLTDFEAKGRDVLTRLESLQSDKPPTVLIQPSGNSTPLEHKRLEDLELPLAQMEGAMSKPVSDATLEHRLAEPERKVEKTDLAHVEDSNTAIIANARCVNGHEFESSFSDVTLEHRLAELEKKVERTDLAHVEDSNTAIIANARCVNSHEFESFKIKITNLQADMERCTAESESQFRRLEASYAAQPQQSLDYLTVELKKEFEANLSSLNHTQDALPVNSARRNSLRSNMMLNKIELTARVSQLEKEICDSHLMTLQPRLRRCELRLEEVGGQLASFSVA